jgi:CHAT domain-containing protein/Tfp pilus assembly protein PilF
MLTPLLLRRAVPYLFVLVLLLVLVTTTPAQEARWKELDAQAEKLCNEGKFVEALRVAQQALDVAESTFAPENLNFAKSLHDVALLYTQQGQYTEAEPLHKRALGIREKMLGPNHLDVAESLEGLAAFYKLQGRYAEAEPLYRRAIGIFETAPGSERSEELADTLGNLGALCQAQGRYAEAEQLCKRAAAIYEKTLGPAHYKVAISVNNVGKLYFEQGRYGDAEPFYKRALAIYDKSLGPEHPLVGVSVNNLALLYDQQGRYSEAEILFKRALAIFEKTLGPDHPTLATLLNNLGMVYFRQGLYNEAEPLYKRSLTIYENKLGPEHPSVALPLSNLAGVYRTEGRYWEAEILLRRALAIREKAFGPQNSDLATVLNNLGELYFDQARYNDAEPLYKRAEAIYDSVLGPEHANVATLINLSNLAMLYDAEKSPQQAASFYDRSLTALANQFDYYFSYMSEKDRLTFLTTVSDRFPRYFRFCLNYRQKFPDLLGKMYDVVLWEKGFIAQSVIAQREQIESGGDKETLGLLNQLTAKKTEIARLLTAQPTDREQWHKQIDQVTQEANELESKLVRRSASLAEQMKLAHVSWRDVQKSLKSGQAAVEFVRFPYYDGKNLTDANFYVALIVRPESRQPTLVVLIDPNNAPQTLEQGALRNYRQSVNVQQAAATNTPSFYDVFWKPLEPALAGVKHIYVSPDGALNQVSFSVVPDSSGKLLIERYDLRVIFSTKDILRDKRHYATNTAVLIGNPAFGLEESAQRATVLSLQKNVAATGPPNSGPPAPTGMTRGPLSRDRFSGALDTLPATQTELNEIHTLLEKKKWQVQLYTGQQALKESIKRVQHPRVLHVATHGFFEPDEQRQPSGPGDDRPAALEDPMLRSGLFFAGANRTLTGKPTPDDIDDGILTAYEATGLNLQGTELVVLSACDTGRGEQQTGEGVFGLRRAFQEAGARSVLMSMWSVPDQETQELMTLFYSKWLAGKDKHDALREAQLELRETVKSRYGKDSPFYWGAFVLVGQ